MAISVLNTDAGLSGKTIANLEDTQTITGAKTFDRDPNPPFAVSSGSAVVPNLDADKVDGYEGAQLAVLAENETVTGTWTLSNGISFPASQSAQSGVNTLDDYEEGTWTPVIGGSGGTSGQTYTHQVGEYVKIGKLVHATFNVLLSAKGTITTDVQIQGLPFTLDTSTNHTPALVVSYFVGLGANKVYVGGYGNPNTTAATVTGLGAAAAAHTALATADIGNTTQLVGSITYIASA